MRKREIAAYTGGVWLLVFLFETPRGDRILRKLDRFIFPDWLTR